ncbi:hypothetical protein ADL00_35800 [Streptomyces sp. AS58]|nr:hypothetical protein ADL00_35800 [Streptomyces sp. AS58]
MSLPNAGRNGVLSSASADTIAVVIFTGSPGCLPVTSSTWARRPPTVASWSATRADSPIAAPAKFVRIAPGCAISTLIPSGATSWASETDRPSRANLPAEQADSPGTDICPPRLLIWTIAPLAHVRQDRPGECGRADEVELHQRPELGLRGLLDGTDVAPAGGVDEHVDASV